MRCNIHASGAFHVFDVSKVSVIFRKSLMTHVSHRTKQRDRRARARSLSARSQWKRELSLPKESRAGSHSLFLWCIIYFCHFQSHLEDSEMEQERERGESMSASNLSFRTCPFDLFLWEGLQCTVGRSTCRYRRNANSKTSPEETLKVDDEGNGPHHQLNSSVIF